MVYNYSTKITEDMAKAVLIAAPISPKHCIEICNLVRKKPLDDARKILEDVVDMKKPIPFKRFNSDVGHKKGMGPGRYPVKAAQAILNLFDSVEANAQFKGLNTGNLFIRHLSTQRAARPMRFGRQRGLLGKRSTVEIVVEEKAVEKKKKETKKEPVKDVKAPAKPKVEAKTELKEEKKEAKEKVEVKTEKPEEKKEVKKEIKAEPAPKVEEKKEVKQEVKKEEKETPKVEEKKTEEKKELPKKESESESKEKSQTKTETKPEVKEDKK